MKSPAAEWSLAIGYLAVLDYLRAHGEADGDTASEVLRGVVERTPHGKALLGGALVAGGVLFYRHICDPLR